MRNFLKTVFIILPLLFLASCGNNYTPDQIQYIAEIEKERAVKDSIFGQTEDSPFFGDENAHFHPLLYYDVKPEFVFNSKLYRYETEDTIKVFGTKGEERSAVKYGYLKFNFDKKEHKLNVYKSFSKSGEEYFSIWFTDHTTGEETYGVGRYLDFELNPEAEHIYTIDFNKAYNPYCAYSARFSCAVPTKEDHLDMAVKAGEKRHH